MSIDVSATFRTVGLQTPYPNHYKGMGLHNGRFLQKIRASALHNESVKQIHGKALQLLENERHEIIGVSYRESLTSEIKSIHAPLTITLSLIHISEPTRPY